MLRARLMFPDRNVDLDEPLPDHAGDLVADLGLDILLGAFAGGDPFLDGVGRHALLVGARDEETIRYRQGILADALARPEAVRRLYEIAVGAIEGERKFFLGMFSDAPDVVMRRSVRILSFLHGSLRELRQLADRYAGAVDSPGLSRLFELIRDELTDTYLDTVAARLRELRFRRGVLLGARLGRGNAGTGYTLLRDTGSLLGRLRIGPNAGYGFEIAERDMHGGKVLSRLQAMGMNEAANAVGRAADQVLAFFGALRAEAAFYVGALQLHERLVEAGVSTCLPEVTGEAGATFRATGLADPVLALATPDGGVVPNDVDATGRPLVVITGANQGGKSTFLRSVGVARLMTQAGMFATAEELRAGLVGRVFTHYKREEDPAMRSGKLDEELRRMSEIVDAIRPGDLLLCNESFASTNEREGSEIARQIVDALIAAGVEVFFVTHLFDLADGFRRRSGDALFLRAERGPEGRRTFRLVEGDPMPTSFGEDVFREVFGAPLPEVEPAAPDTTRGRR